ncbi:hypothetical protein [Staphylococcus agnetis]|uniref:hypothetical protein n=1 Tax=Staphylococcus agnetis TaxID=985762 RepID=UPI0039ED0D24
MIKSKILFITVPLLLMMIIYILVEVLSYIKLSSLNLYMLVISFISLFATFGGAYFGAKISGEYTIKAAYKQIEENKKMIKQKADFLIEDVMVSAVSKINSFRPWDFGTPFKLTIDNKKHSFMPTFTETEYKRVDDYYLNELDEILKDIKTFRLSETFFYWWCKL